MVRALAAFGANDLRSVRRDSLLFFVLLGPFVYLALVRFVIPPLTGYLVDAYGFDLTPYYPLLLSAFLVLGCPVLIGTVAGFLLLDERDYDTLTALKVTPVPTGAFAAYRAATAIFVSALYVLVTLSFSDLMPLSLLPKAIAIALLAGLLSNFVALSLAAFASNKVEGLAIIRAIGGLLFVVPLIPYFIDSSWQLLFGLVPSYWPAKAFWVASEGANFWPYLLVGFVYNLALTLALLRRFQKKVFF